MLMFDYLIQNGDRHILYFDPSYYSSLLLLDNGKRYCVSLSLSLAFSFFLVSLISLKYTLYRPFLMQKCSFAKYVVRCSSKMLIGHLIIFLIITPYKLCIYIVLQNSIPHVHKTKTAECRCTEWGATSHPITWSNRPCFVASPLWSIGWSLDGYCCQYW